MEISSDTDSNLAKSKGMIFQLADGSIQGCDRNAEKILGYTAQQLQQVNYFQLPWRTIDQDHTEFPLDVHPAIATLKTSQPYDDVIMGFDKPDSKLVWLKLSCQPLYQDSSHRAYGVITTIEEIAENLVHSADISSNLKSVSLPSNWQFIDELADAVPAILYLYDGIAKRNIYINSQTYDLLGYTQSQILAMGTDFPSRMMHPDDLARFPDHIAKLKQSHQGEICQFKHRIRHQNGEWRWFCNEDRVYERTTDGAIKQVLGIARDITDCKQRKYELGLITELIPQQIWTAATDGHIDYINQRWQDYTGLNLEQMRRQGWAIIVHPDDLENIKDKWIQAVKTGSKFEIEVRLRGANGEYSWFLSQARPLQNEQGEIIKWYGTNTSITRIKELEQTLIQQTKDLTNANQLKDEFMAIVSHELRTPLNPILGWSQLLATGKLDAEKTAQGIEIIQRNAKLQTRLIDDLLDVSYILRGSLNLDPIPLNLESVVKSALATMNLKANPKKIQIETILKSDIGKVMGDANRLQQIVCNLISNAVKFTPDGGRITIKLDKIGDRARIQVEDTGKGINSEFLPYVFDRFRQAESSTTRRFGGLGLGLAIVRHLTELHGGTVAVDSLGENKGTIFTVKLPQSGMLN